MSTGPGPTRKADGTADATVDEIADLLVEDEVSAPLPAKDDTPHDNLDVMPETPGPALASSFMPPPPSPVGDTGDDREGAEDAGGATNLAYEDLLAKLVLPARAPEPASEMPAVVGTLPLPEPDSEVAALTPLLSPPSAQSLQIAPPAEERTLVTDNPLIAEEQEAAFREGRTASRDQPVLPREDLRTLPTGPVMPGTVVAKSKLIYLMFGGLLVLGGMMLAVLVLRLLLPTPTQQPAPVVVPAAPPPPSAPAHVVPLPPSAPPPAVVPIPAEPAAAAAIPELPEVVPERPSEPERPAPKARRTSGHSRAPRQVVLKPPRASASKASSPAPKAPKSKKSSKSTGFADPFDN